MSAADALRAAYAAVIMVSLDGDDLVLEAAAPPPAAVLDLLTRHKAGIIALLRPRGDGWAAEDWRAYFDERAGIAEHDLGLPRPEAEARAFACCVSEWLNQNPVASPPGRCLGCGEADHLHDPLVPFGTKTTGHAWLHGCCWSVWHAARNAEAVAALAAMGIEEGSIHP